MSRPRRRAAPPTGRGRSPPPSAPGAVERGEQLRRRAQLDVEIRQRHHGRALGERDAAGVAHRAAAEVEIGLAARVGNVAVVPLSVAGAVTAGAMPWLVSAARRPGRAPVTCRRSRASSVCAVFDFTLTLPSRSPFLNALTPNAPSSAFAAGRETGPGPLHVRVEAGARDLRRAGEPQDTDARAADLRRQRDLLAGLHAVVLSTTRVPPADRRSPPRWSIRPAAVAGSMWPPVIGKRTPPEHGLGTAGGRDLHAERLQRLRRRLGELERGVAADNLTSSGAVGASASAEAPASTAGSGASSRAPRAQTRTWWRSPDAARVAPRPAEARRRRDQARDPRLPRRSSALPTGVRPARGFQARRPTTRGPLFAPLGRLSNAP